MGIKADLIAILETLKYPVFLQGSLNPDVAYPESFFTFWNFETPEAAFYDDNANRAAWGFWVYFYSTNPLLVETEPEKARKLLKASDYILQGKANDIEVDRPTHTGAFFTVFKFENYSEESEPTPEPENNNADNSAETNENTESEVLNNGEQNS